MCTGWNHPLEGFSSSQISTSSNPGLAIANSKSLLTTSSHVVPLIVQRPSVRSKRMLRVRTASASVSPMTFMFGLRSRGTSLSAGLETAAPTWNAITTPVVSKSMLLSGPRLRSTTR